MIGLLCRIKAAFGNHAAQKTARLGHVVAHDFGLALGDGLEALRDDTLGRSPGLEILAMRVDHFFGFKRQFLLTAKEILPIDFWQVAHKVRKFHGHDGLRWIWRRSYRARLGLARSAIQY